MAFRIDETICAGCGACAFACLFNVPKPTGSDKQKYIIEKEKCLGCGQCENICPVGAIVPEPDHKRIKKVTIDPAKCKGCTLCARVCVAKAPKGVVKEPFEIDQERCFQCGLCATKCRFDAIVIETYYG